MPATFPPAIFQSFAEKSDPANVAPRLQALRAQMSQAGVDGFLIPRADAHRGESVPPSEARLAYVTGFTGSAGVAVIGPERAALFIDSRYTLQAPAQTDTTLVDVIEIGQGTTLGTEIGNYVPANGVLAYDPWLHTPAEIRELTERLAGRVTLRPVANLVDAIWTDRPAPPNAPITLRSDNLTGKSSAGKLEDLATALQAEGADAVVLNLPESICWLLNIRGSDVPNAPFVLGYATVDKDRNVALYVDGAKLTPERLAAIRPLADLVHPVAEFPAALEALGGAGKRVLVDPATAPEAVAAALKAAGATLVEKRDPVLLPKSRKNEAELAGMREAHKLDGIALAKFLAWFAQSAPTGTLTEIAIVTALEAFRREEPTCLDASFDTISGAGPNGAIVHYRVTEKTNRTLAPGELMLVDSGAQYLSGTTDITRTMACGPATDEQRDRFTRVLKGMIAISMARFPKGTSGAQIDVLARQFLWQAGVTYNHGTGHGVGAALSVHEGPIGISSRYTLPLEPGMVLSNEPGYYKSGEYGIRIENLLAVRDSAVAPGFLEFETLTLVPIDRQLIDETLLLPPERAWLNTYHARVRTEISPHLTGEVRTWLEAATAPLTD
ncbi:aminopeptidase P family protein [Devosia sp. 1635]|uniref:aminopeptidase P family protein n=1 Tax=Devosia sp. 1635 TaxID=2726066 RepID=UPI001566B461|nr:aminopeptidase P family protein [Devosia sp. 1635]